MVRAEERIYPEPLPENNTMNIIEQLKIALTIEEAKEAGNPIEWEVANGHKWCEPTFYRNPPNPVYCIGIGREIRLKPWTLGRSINGHTLPDGAEWMFDGWTKDDLPADTRPLMKGEIEQHDDYWLTISGVWIPVINIEQDASAYAYKRRTTRPIPIPDKWVKEKAAFAEGKGIQAGTWNTWEVCSDPSWIKDCEYRIKPEPVMVELGPSDVPPGSVMRCLNDQGDTSWWAVSQVYTQGIYLSGELLDWRTMRDRGMEIHRPSKPGVWEKCEKLSHE